VRELQSLMTSAAALAGHQEGELTVDLDLLDFARGAQNVRPVSSLNLNNEISALEKRMIMAALTETGNNRSEAARLLGISRIGLLKKLDRLGLRDSLSE
jgi:two-component system NtrC family response regulator